MKYIKTLAGRNLKNTLAKGGCGECQLHVNLLVNFLYCRKSKMRK